MRVIVQKFGGTSVSTPERREQAVGHIARAVADGYDVVVVVSALGRRGEPYATDTLLSLVDGKRNTLSPRETDLLLSCGEIISAVLTVEALSSKGYPATALTGAQAGVVTDDRFGDARILEVKPERILSHLRNGEICVVTGFQGVTREGEVTTLGRGGSDTTAAALGVALKAEVVEIYTDVDGIKTADPRVMPGAKTLTTMTYREVAEMAHLGAKVIHPRAVEIAMVDRVPLLIKGTFSDAPGTLICDTARQGVEIRGDRVVTGIAHMTHLGQVKVGNLKGGLGHRHLDVFRAMAGAGISVDLINVSPELISFAVGEEHLERARQTVESLGLGVEATGGFAKVSAVGAGMRGVPGVMARVIAALSGHDVPIYQTTDSHTSISCLIRAEDLEPGIKALHEEFELDHLEHSGGGAVS